MGAGAAFADAGQAVIIEWGTWGRSERDTLRLGAKALGAAVELHHLSAPVDVLFARIQRRGMEDPPLTQEDLAQSAGIFQAPTIEEAGLFDAYKIIKPAEDLETPAPQLDQDRRAVERIFDEYAAIPYSHGDLTCETIFDRTQDRYLLMTFGRDMGKRVHFTLAHVDIVGDKLWIRWDGRKRGLRRSWWRGGCRKKTLCWALSRSRGGGTRTLRSRDTLQRN